ncbi:protein MODIFIER OF SNC1 1 isoform X2 [Cryptomeria japonica]|uniref:protein MODIFIER OF SNC1 1 isoform X2 n=1 Tax=Cryptomeria japonica TaxID=3369 RepID=UPI0027DA7D34|nr:protein MODIFIER OF SNC1 1 isoform X2 [Cryptomeria japonica]
MVTSAMLTGERRGVSARRSGMTVLGKVPKPLNLPSQRLENRGLDPNVEIVPKGTVSWGTGHSPPTTVNAWGAASFSSSPPANAGVGGNRSNVSTARPSSGGSGTRPSTAGSDHSHEPATPNAWSYGLSRPSSASGALGMGHSQSTLTRPCSAESRPGSSHLSRFADSSIESNVPWGGSGTSQKLGENHPQPARFTLTSVDFPTLGSDKNPDLRPQHGNASTTRPMSTSEGLAQKEKLKPSLADWNDEASTGKDRRPRDMLAPDEGHAPKEGFHRKTFVHTVDSWHYDDGINNCTASKLTEEEWHRAGPPVAPYGPPGGQVRFPFTAPGYIRPAFEYGPVPYAQRPHGPGGYGRQGEMYGPYMAQPMVAGRPGVPLGNSLYPNQLPFDGYYGPPGIPSSHYGNIDEREMAMTRMGAGPGMYGGYPHYQGHPVDGPRFQYNGPGSGVRPATLLPLSREQNDLTSHGRVASEGTDKTYSKQVDVWMSKDADNSSDNSRPFHPQDSNTRRNSSLSAGNPQSEKDNSRTALSGHRNWGTVSSDEKMDFSKPVFDEEALSSREFEDSRISVLESNHEKGANVTRVAEQTNLSDKKHVQVKTKDGMDSYKSSVLEDLNKERKRDCAEIDPNRAAHSVDHFQTGLEHHLKVGGLPQDEKKFVATVEKFQLEDVKFGEEASKQKVESYSTSRNHALCQEAQTLVTPLKGSDEHISTDGPDRISVVAMPIPERNLASNTSVKLKGGLSSASGSNNLSLETPKISDKVQLLKRSDNHRTENTLDSEGAVLQAHGTQGPKGIQETLQKECNTTKGRFNAHEGDSEWKRKLPVVESALKAAKPNSAHGNRHIVTYSTADDALTGSEDFGDKPAGESHIQQCPASHDYEAQRAKLKEAAAQRAKELLREEEERIKEQKAKALLKLEELNRRALGVATPQDVGNSRSENMTSATFSGSEVVSEDTQKHQAGSYSNNGEQNDNLREADNVLNNNAVCELPPVQVSEPSETPGSLEKSASDALVKSGKNDRSKRENYRRSSNVSREDPKYQLKTDDQKSHLKQRENNPNTSSLQNAAMLPVLVVPVSASILTSPSTSEALQKDIQVTCSDSSSVAGQVSQPEFPKQAWSRQKAKQYVFEQKSSGSQSSILDKTEQIISPDSGNSVNLAGESNMLQAPGSCIVEKSSDTIASGGDGSISRKKKYSKNAKNKNKIDKSIVTVSSTGSSNDDHIVALQPNSISGDSKHEGGLVISNTIKAVEKGVEIQNIKSELGSVQNGGNDTSVTHDTVDATVVDHRILQSTDDTSTGRVTQVKSHFPKRSYRVSQEARVSDKSQVSEGRVWAPVRAANHQVTTNDKQKLDQIEVQPSGVDSSEVVVQNPIRNKRAEIERYVPKPVAKEQAQHNENCQHFVAGSSFSARDQMDQKNKHGAVKNVVTSETQQQHSSFGENKGHISGKQGKQNGSWRQRNSNEIRENTKVSHTHQSIEGESALPLQTNEVTVSRTRHTHIETKGFKSEGIEIHPQPHQPDLQKPRHVEELPNSVAVQSNKQQILQCEAEQSTQLASEPHLQTSNSAKDQEPQLAYKRDQNMHDQRFYQANRSRPKSQKFSGRQVYMEGNHQFTRVTGVSEESEENHRVEQSFVHQRPRSSAWTPKPQGSADHKEHHLHQKLISGQPDTHQLKMDSNEEQHDSETRVPEHLKTICDQQEGPLSSTKKHQLQEHSFGQQVPASPNQFEGKNQNLNSDVDRTHTGRLSQQQLKLTHPDRQTTDKEQPKQIANSMSYQQRRQANHGHWQQTGAGTRSGTRVTDGYEEHPQTANVQSRKQHDTSIPRNSESSLGAGQHHRQDTSKQQPLINSNLTKQNLQVHSQPISSQKPLEFYQPKAGLASRNGDNHEINPSITPHGGSSWSGEHRGSHGYRGRDHSHARRGRSSGRGGGSFGLRGN